MTQQQKSSADIVDPADLWDRYCAETPAKRRSPQGAMAFAVDALTGDVAQSSQVRLATIEECRRLVEEMTHKHGSPVGPAYDNGVWDQGVRISAKLSALAAQPPAAPVTFQQSEPKSAATVETDHRGSSADNVEAALRDAFPHFQDGSPITPEAIRGIGKEYLDMVMSWEPHKDEIEFADHKGTIRKIVYEPGDYEVGINPGWVLEDDTLDEPQTSSMTEAMGEIANRAGNFMDADAGEWMPSIYKIACEAVGVDPWPLLEANGWKRDQLTVSLTRPKGE